MRSGRVSVWTIVIAIPVIVIVAFMFLGGESSTTAASRFMSALAKHDVATLTEMSDLPGQDKEAIRKQWDYALNVAAPYYVFRWALREASRDTGEEATVQLYVWRNAASPSSYEEPFEMRLRKVEGKWKVQVDQLHREMFPALPR